MLLNLTKSTDNNDTQKGIYKQTKNQIQLYLYVFSFEIQIFLFTHTMLNTGEHFVKQINV